MSEAAILDLLYQHILDGEAEPTVELAEKGLDEGIQATVLLFDAMVPALEEVGTLFETGVYFLPEMLISANAMKAGMEILRPHLSGPERESIGTFVIGTVAGDIHDIGKNMCSVMLEAAGFEIIDLGINVPGAAFVSAVEEHRPDVVGMSAFLTTTMGEIATNIGLLQAAGLRDSVKVIVGGPPLDEAFAASVGADAYAPDASSATRVTKAMLGSAP